MKFDYKLETLDSGLRVVTVPMSVPTVSVLALVGVGSRFEEEKKLGISHFVEHMVFKGTKKYPTAQVVASTVDAIGAEFNAFTSKEYTGFYVKAASDKAEVGLDIVGQFLGAALLRAEDLGREKGVIVEEINMYEDTPARRIGDIFDQLIYAGHALGRDIIGSKETVTGLEREDFVEHMGAWYQANNIVLGLAGDKDRIMNHELGIMGQMKKHLGSKKQTLDKFTSMQTKPQVKVHYKKTEQAHFGLGVPALPRGHKDRYVLAILATILGGNMSSRLFTEVREKRGLAYYVRTGIDTFAETGHMTTFAGVTVDKVDEAIKAVIEQYHKVSEDGNVSQAELQRAKDYLKGKLLIDLEDSLDVANRFVEPILLEGKVRTPEESVAGIEAVTVDEVRRVAHELLRRDKLNLAVIGPYGEVGRFEKLL